jgi:hypothetical protein
MDYKACLHNIIKGKLFAEKKKHIIQGFMFTLLYQ